MGGLHNYNHYAVIVDCPKNRGFIQFGDSEQFEPKDCGLSQKWGFTQYTICPVNLQKNWTNFVTNLLYFSDNQYITTRYNFSPGDLVSDLISEN